MSEIIDLGTSDTVGDLLDKLNEIPFNADFGFRQQPEQHLYYDKERVSLYFQEPHINITGLYGCSCHPFTTWGECEAAHNQRMTTGQNVKNRHTGRIGEIYGTHKQKGFVTVKYGELMSDLHLEHVAMLIKQ